MYRSAYGALDSELDGDTLLRLLDQTEAMFRYRGHIGATEMPLGDLAGQRVLEVGSGAGAHSALFAKHGARVVAVDLTEVRVRATAAKFALLGPIAQDCRALQADGENLPFPDDSFDIVYSNGVLHHSSDTQKAVSELLRVLRPGGRAVVMLYCRSSINYWLALWLGYGVLRGGLWRGGTERLGARTEWSGSEKPTVENPITRSYTRGELMQMFRAFSNVHLRKSDFSMVHLPMIGKLYRAWLARRGRLHPGGVLPYGEPWPIASRFELCVGRHLGWAWNISATKGAPGPR